MSKDIQLNTFQDKKLETTKTNETHLLVEIPVEKNSRVTHVVFLSELRKTTETLTKGAGSSSTKTSSPMEMMGKISELESLEKGMKKMRLAVSGAAVDASSPSTKTASSAKSTKAGSLGSSDTPDFPTNNPNYPPAPDIPIPTNADDFNSALQDWLNALKASPNPNALFGFLSWLTRLPNASWAKEALDKLASVQEGGESLAEMMIDQLRDTWYQEGGADKVTQEMNKLVNQLNGLAGNNKFMEQLDFWAKQDTRDLPSWIQSRKDNPVDPDEFFYTQLGDLFDFFKKSSSLNKYLHDLFMKHVDDLVKRFKSNPALLITLIFSTMGQSMNNMQYQFGGYGNLQKYLKEISSKLSDIEKEYADMGTKDGISGSDLKKLVSQVEKLKTEVNALQSLFGETIVSDTNSAFDKLLNTKVNSDGETLEDFFKSNPSDQDWNNVAGSDFFKDQFYSKGDSTPGQEKPPGPTDLTREIQQAMQAAGTAYTSQSQTISIKMKTLSSQIQSLVSEIKSVVIKDYSQGWIAKLVQNQIQP